MKLTFDISATEFVIVRDILADIIPSECRVWVFGSRVKNQARFNSDLDLALECKDKLPPIILYKLKEAFSDSLLPYRVDVLDINGVSEKFQTIIRQQAIAFPLAKSDRVPKLRFPEFRDAGNWEDKRLGEVARFSKGKGISKADVSPKGSLPCIRYGELYTHYQETIGRVVSYTSISPENLVLSHANDVIIPASGETQIDIATASCVVHDGIALGGDLNIIRSEMNGGFLSYYLNGAQRKSIAQMAQGISVVHLYPNQLTTLKVCIPSLPEQRKIASFLSAIDTKIEQLGKKKALLEQYKKGCMQKLFSQELRFKDEQGNDFPDWGEKRLGEVFDERTERNNTNLEMLSVTLANGVMLAQLLGRHDTSPTDKSKYKRVYIRDIAYNSMRMWQGASGVSKYTGIVSPAYTVIKPCDEQHSAFFGYYFKLTRVIQTFQRHSQGLTSDTWNLKYPALSRIKLLIPSFLEQQKIATFLSAIDTKTNLITTELEHSKTFKKGLLQQMFV